MSESGKSPLAVSIGASSKVSSLLAMIFVRFQPLDVRNCWLYDRVTGGMGRPADNDID